MKANGRGYAKARQLEAQLCQPIANVQKRTEVENTASPPAFRIGDVTTCCFLLSTDKSFQMSATFLPNFPGFPANCQALQDFPEPYKSQPERKLST